MINSFDGDSAIVPSFLHPSSSGKSNIDLDKSNKQSHHYNMRSKCKTTTISRQIVVEAIHYSFVIAFLAR